jgi:uncharacterized protein YrrD
LHSRALSGRAGTRLLLLSTLFAVLRSAPMSMLWMLIVLACVSNTVLVMRGEAAASDVAFPLYKMREILGQGVTTAQGKEVGHIENVILDAATGDLLYGVVSSGGGC